MHINQKAVKEIKRSISRSDIRVIYNNIKSKIPILIRDFDKLINLIKLIKTKKKYRKKII